MACKILNIIFKRININVKYSIVLVADAMMKVYFYGMFIFTDLKVFKAFKSYYTLRLWLRWQGLSRKNNNNSAFLF